MTISPETQRRAEIEALKIDCLSSGIRIGPDALAALGGADRLTIHEYATTGGVCFEIESGVFLNAAFDDWYCDQARAELADDGQGTFVVRHEDRTFPVEWVVPLPGYLDKRDAAGSLVVDVVMSHVDRIRLSPLLGCAFDCWFCDLPAEKYTRRDADTLIRALEIAVADEALPTRHLLISGGTAGPRHEAWFLDTCVAVIRRADELRLDVDVMMAPTPDGPDVVDKLVDAGVTGFSFNLELFGSKESELYIGRKHRRARPYFDRTVGRAVERLGRTGAVRSLIIPGLESVQSTLDGVEHVASLGADPVLSPFRPARRTRLVDAKPVSREVLAEVLAGARDLVAAAGVSLGPQCLACQHNTLTFPWDVRTSAGSLEQ